MSVTEGERENIGSSAVSREPLPATESRAKLTAAERFSLSILAWRSSRSGPSPMISQVKSRPSARKLRASVDEVLKSFKRNEPADTDDARRWVRLAFRNAGDWKTSQVDPVINTVNFRSGIRTALAKQRRGCNRFRPQRTPRRRRFPAGDHHCRGPS